MGLVRKFSKLIDIPYYHYDKYIYNNHITNYIINKLKYENQYETGDFISDFHLNQNYTYHNNSLLENISDNFKKVPLNEQYETKDF